MCYVFKMIKQTLTAFALLLFSSDNFYIEEEIMNKSQVEESWMRPVLYKLNEVLPRSYTEDAIDLMLGTMAQESNFGHYIVQVGANSTIGAKGPLQVESLTNISKWNNFLRYNPEVAKYVRGIAAQHAFDSIFDGEELSKDFTKRLDDGTYKVSLVNSELIDSQLVHNFAYNLVMARLKYWTVKDPIPGDLVGKANYWDRYYNANPEKGTVLEYIESYHKYVR